MNGGFFFFLTQLSKYIFYYVIGLRFCASREVLILLNL